MFPTDIAVLATNPRPDKRIYGAHAIEAARSLLEALEAEGEHSPNRSGCSICACMADLKDWLNGPE